MKTFLNSFLNFVFCLKFHLQQSLPHENFRNSPSPSPPPPLDFEKFQFPLDIVEF